MKKIFLILTLFFVFCVNVCAYPSDFFKSYPNGNIKINIDWDNGKGYYDANFYDGKNNKVKAKKNWENFWDINSFQEFYDTLKNKYSNQKIKVLINITNEEHPIGMFLNAKFYDSKGILVREANNDRFSHNTKIYDGNGKLINETENNIQQNEFIFKKYGKNSKLLNETYISFDYNQIGVKAYNNNNILIMESSYTIKNLDFDNVKIIMSNLFENSNYKDVLDGYEKFYDDNGNLELEKTYKNGELVDTKEYSTSSINTKNLKTTSKNEVQNNNNNFSNNSNKTKEVSLNKNGNSSENNSSWYYFIGALVIVIIILGIYRLLKAFPKTKYLSYGQQIRIFQILMKYNENDRYLFSARRINGIGTGYYRIRSMTVGYDKVYIYAKVFSILFMPTPIILGYLLCYDEKRILASFSEETFSKAKKEIEETVL